MKKNKITVFISQPMHDVSEEEYQQEFERAKRYIKKWLKDRFGPIHYKEKKIKFVSTYYLTSKEKKIARNDRFWYLGRAIQYLEGVDYIYFTPDAKIAKGCRAEMEIASIYNINIII